MNATCHTAALLLAACAAPPAPAREDIASVAIDIVRNHVLLPVRVAGSPPFRIILDTGMPTRGLMLYASERVDALGLDLQEAPAVSGAGGSGGGIATRVAPGVRVQVGELLLEDVLLIVLPRPAAMPRDSEGIIGAELFERFAVHIDPDTRRLDLWSSPAAPAEDTSVVPLHFRQGMSFVDLRVAVGGGEPQAVELAVDLGASHGLWLNARADGTLAPPADSASMTLGRGLSGDIQGRRGRVRRLEIGDFAFERVITMFPEEQHQNPGGVDFRDGFVGSEILTRFDLVFDYPASRLLLRPGRRFAEPFEHDMSGLQLDPAGEERIPVTAVLPDSPAAQAGIRAGDALLAVDGTPVATLGPDGLRRALQVEGAEVLLRFSRGAETFEQRITLRRLL